MVKWKLAIRGVALGALVAMAFSTVPGESDALNLVRARLFRGGSNSGPVPGWPAAPNSVDARTWPPACGRKQSAVTSMFSCAKKYFGVHPKGAVYGNGAGPANTGATVMFNANGWDIHNTATVLGNVGFPVLILRNLEDYGNAVFGPGLGAGAAGNITFNATGNDPGDLGTQVFAYNPDGTLRNFKYPPNSAMTTPRPNPTPPNHGGKFKYVTGPQRFGGTLNLTGVNAAYLVLTFNPGVATTGSFPVIQGAGTPIPTVTPVSNLTVPGATLIDRNKGVEVQKIRINNGITVGGFVNLGATQGSTNTFAMREQGPFTTGMVTVTEMSRPGVFPTTTTRMDQGGRSTVMGVGTVQLVQPFIIRSKGPNGNNGRAYTNKLILEVPEPGSLLLLGSGVMGFVGLAALRRRRSS